MDKLDFSTPEALILSLSVVMLSFIGSFLASYMKKKGLNYATKDDFESLLEQTKKTTEETENIKHEIAQLNWAGQRQWQLKEKYYESILENIFKLKITLEERSDYFIDPKSRYDPDNMDTEHYQIQSQRGNEALEIIQRLSGPGAIVISQASIEALKVFNGEMWYSKGFGMGQYEYVSDSLKAVDTVYGIVLQAAKVDLAG
ncbi:MAG: hypothetical protein V7785_00130 [Bermanella sp.]